MEKIIVGQYGEKTDTLLRMISISLVGNKTTTTILNKHRSAFNIVKTIPGKQKNRMNVQIFEGSGKKKKEFKMVSVSVMQIIY